jgi:hypothetical protein
LASRFFSTDSRRPYSLDCHEEPTICHLLKLKERQHSGIANAAAVFPFVGKPKPAAPALFEQAPDCAQPATNGGRDFREPQKIAIICLKFGVHPGNVA